MSYISIGSCDETRQIKFTRHHQMISSFAECQLCMALTYFCQCCLHIFIVILPYLLLTFHIHCCENRSMFLHAVCIELKIFNNTMLNNIYTRFFLPVLSFNPQLLSYSRSTSTRLGTCISNCSNLSKFG